MLYKEILTQALSSTILKDENLQAIAAQLIHDTCCQAVLEIQAILADDTRTDKDCFYQIEKEFPAETATTLVEKTKPA